MASALLVTYERKHILSRNTAMKKPLKPLNGYALDPGAPELSYATETVADSDGRRPKPVAPYGTHSLGTSVEPPSETASEDSCSLKRKSMSLNADSIKDAFNSAATFYSFPSKNLSRDERRHLRKRLKLELEQVLSLSLKLEAKELQLKGLPQSDVLLESHSDLHMSRVNNGSVSKLPCELLGTAVESSQREGRLSRQPSIVVPEFNQETPGTAGKDKRTPKANQLYVNSEFVSGKDKLLPPEKLKPKPVSSLKRSLQGKVDARDCKRQKIDISHSRKLSELLRQCGMILKKLMSHKHGWVFNEPVDVVKMGLHDYLKIIQKPMDLGTIKKKLEGGIYLLPSEFAEDVRLTFANAMKYNPQGHDVYVMADILRQIFEDRWKSVEEKLKDLGATGDRLMQELKEPEIAKPPQVQVQEAKEPNRLIAEDVRTSAARRSKPAPPAKPVTQSKSKAAANTLNRQMTFEEKRTLSKNLESLPVDKLEQIVQIIKNKDPNLTQTDDEIEVDIDSFDTQTLWELHRFVMECNRSKGKNKKSAEKGQLDGGTVKRPKPSNGVTRISKVNQRVREGGEEEVDIGDNMPSGDFPPVVIDKDGGVGNKNCSSSSSSSDSGSSSSDSDSGSSSGSDSDADDVQSAGAGSKVSPGKEPAGSGAVGDRRGSPALEVDGAKMLQTGSLSDLDEEFISVKAVPEPDSQREGEGSMPEQEVFPERRLRAALLRNRFADTILKAQEKTLPLNKSDRVDPEKLRKEREELERRQKEEKARLQAEARAAELARKKAEAEAAAEARRRREAEREAARLALQNMERTVEIDENSEILKDLEMLRSAPSEHIPSSGDETSPVHSPDGLSAFALQGGNPLEQLGLFMKEDDEEEEHEMEPAGLPQIDNVDGSAGDEDEEGEIED